MPPLKKLSFRRDGAFHCQTGKVQYLQKNSHAFNYNSFSPQIKLCHLEDINIVYNLFASLFHRKFYFLPTFHCSQEKKNYFYELSQDGFIQQVKPSRSDRGGLFGHIYFLLIYFKSLHLYFKVFFYPIKYILFSLLPSSQPSKGNIYIF